MSRGARRVVGVLGGTFDPVHAGHLHAARAVRRAFALPRLLLVPCAVPPHKPAGTVSDAAHRVAMLRLALEHEPGLELDTREVARGGISYTIETLESLAREGHAPLWVLGADELAQLHTWHRFETLVREFDLVAVERPMPRCPLEHPALRRHVVPRLLVLASAPPGASLPGPPLGAGGRIFCLRTGSPAISASEIRERARLGLPLDALVPETVARYIRDHGLYRGRVGSTGPEEDGR